MSNDGNRTAAGPVSATPITEQAAASIPQPTDVERVTADIAARLRRVCAHLPDDEFAQLVLDVAQVRMRYDEALYGRVPRHTSNDTA
jgi:hypothetical protein